MDGNAVSITDELIEAGRSQQGGWSKIQLAILGVPWPPPAGWKKCVIGRLISQADAKRFVKLRAGGTTDDGSLF